MRKGFFTAALLLGATVLFIRFNYALRDHDAIIQLCDTCPPGFELTSENECEPRNLYMMYNSLNNKGVGGLKTALPEVRAGFSPQQIDLGRYLFFDPVLSRDGTISCATCHDPDKGFSDGLAQSVGIDNYVLPRSAPSLWNVVYLQRFFWDGRATTLEEQMKGPLYDAHEMGNNPDSLLATLNGIEEYQKLFSIAFPERRGHEITLPEIYKAIAAFESSLISLNSRYDQYAHGYADALSPKEKEGLNVFRSFVARCAECHTPPLFTNQQIAVLGTPDPEGMPFDAGAQIPMNDPTFRGGFKVPSLRNIEKTAPYMHSGRFKDLRETVQFYTDGRGHAVPENEELIIHWHIWEPNLADHELDRLVDFLKTLTDETFKPKIPDQIPSDLNSKLAN
ncbi:MAG: cytochrome c peroxidase [Reichenbachiella sp.]|uniref:cytochrome-c peroxidase n=1 Tax=Reichenbachiella sp. TaxID=2184521 RepID=UPI0032993751